MSYLIMECADSYAVALDEEGRFVKVPNLGYEVGQRVDDVIVFDDDADGAEVIPFKAPAQRRSRGRVAAVIAAAACLCALFVGGFALWQTPVGTVRMSINPDVSMEVNRLDRVVSLTGDNADGVELADGFSYYGRTVDEVSDDLATRAEGMGFLTEGGTIELTVESDDEEWRVATEDRLVVELEVHLDNRVNVTGSASAGEKDADDGAITVDQDIVVEIAPPVTTAEPEKTAVPEATQPEASTPAPSAPSSPTTTYDDDDDWDDDADDGWDDDDDADDWDDDDADDGWDEADDD